MVEATPDDGRRRHAKPRERRWRKAVMVTAAAITIPAALVTIVSYLHPFDIDLPHMHLPSFIWLIVVAVLAVAVSAYFVYLLLIFWLVIAAYAKMRKTKTDTPENIFRLIQGLAYALFAPVTSLKTGVLPKHFFDQSDGQSESASHRPDGPTSAPVASSVQNQDVQYLRDAFRLAFKQLDSVKTDLDILQLSVNDLRSQPEQHQLGNRVRN